MTGEQSRSVWDVHPGDVLHLPGDVSVQMVHKSGRIARMVISAPREAEVKMDRKQDSTPVPCLT